jgi:hypothetical protein
VAFEHMASAMQSMWNRTLSPLRSRTSHMWKSICQTTTNVNTPQVPMHIQGWCMRIHTLIGRQSVKRERNHKKKSAGRLMVSLMRCAMSFGMLSGCSQAARAGTCARAAASVSRTHLGGLHDCNQAMWLIDMLHVCWPAWLVE